MLRCLSIIGFTIVSSCAIAIDPPENTITSGKLADAETALKAVVSVMPKADQARFGLGMVQVGRAIERFGQGMYRHGMTLDGPWALLVSLPSPPIPKNPNPEPIDYDDLRRLISQWVDDLAVAEATLAHVTDTAVKLPLQVGKIQFDFTGQGQGATLFEILRRQGIRPLKSENDFLICFDRGDVAWLRGYCHLMMALGDFLLAYDQRELFESAGHLIFPKAKVPHNFLTHHNDRNNWSQDYVLDVIAFIHCLRFPLVAPERSKSCLAHLEKSVALGKEMWQFILNETDDDHEWIPNPKQTTWFNFRLSRDAIDSWLAILNECDEMLQGKRLAPFWRGHSKQGINVRRFFLEPRQFDLVLWAQGSAATPYLENGLLTRPEVWDRLRRILQGDVFWFAMWVN